MLNSADTVPSTNIVLQASLAIARCRTHADIWATMIAYLSEVPGLHGFDIVLHSDNSTPAATSKFPAPPDELHTQLAEGQPVRCGELHYLPLIASGAFNGWIVLQSTQALNPTLPIWAAQCAQALAAMPPKTDTAEPVTLADRPEINARIQDLQRRNDELAKIMNIGNTLRSRFSISELTQEVVTAIQSLTGADWVVMGLVEAENDLVRIVAGAGNVTRTIRDQIINITLPDLESLLDNAQKLGPFTLSSVQHPLLAEFPDAMLTVIRNPHGALLGMIIMRIDRRDTVMTDELIRTFESVGSQAGIALENARLYTEQQQTVDRLTALNGLSIALSTGQLKPDEVVTMAVGGAVGTTSAAGGGAVVIFDEYPVALHGIGIGGDIPFAEFDRHLAPNVDYVELTGSQVPGAAFAHGIRHILVVPLRGTELSVGCYWICYTQSVLHQSEREMAVLYAKLAGGVLESLYLAGAVRSAHDRMASILRSTKDGMLLVNDSGRIMIANRAFGQLLNTEIEQLPDQDIDRFLGDTHQVALPAEVCRKIADALHAVSAGTSDAAEGEVTIGDTIERDLTWHVLSVSGTTAERSTALLVVRDVTADRQMERLREDLTNMIVHDLRSPLTNVMVSINLLLKQSLQGSLETQTRILRIAAHSCQQMLDLVNSLLDIRRLQQQTLDLQFQPLSLADLAESVAERIEPIATDKRVTLNIDLDRLPEIHGDPDMLRRVLQNLTDNGLKFTRPRSTVQIRGHVAQPEELPSSHPPGTWALIEVEDHGPGIPAEFHEIIFELFAQAPAGYGHGTGVGLAFCKLAVETHGGQIWVQSIPGQGSTFSFTLPIASQRYL